MMKEVCPVIETEPLLQPLSGEIFRFKTTTTDEDVRLDICANGFWGGRFEQTFFDARGFNFYASSYMKMNINSCYNQHENDKSVNMKTAFR